MPVFTGKYRLSADFGADIPGQLASWPHPWGWAILSFARSDRDGPLELPHSPGMLSRIAVMDR
jgi:hypothetical protein